MGRPIVWDKSGPLMTSEDGCFDIISAEMGGMEGGLRGGQSWTLDHLPAGKTELVVFGFHQEGSPLKLSPSNIRKRATLPPMWKKVFSAIVIVYKQYGKACFLRPIFFAWLSVAILIQKD